jgi:hypothetical protein
MRGQRVRTRRTRGTSAMHRIAGVVDVSTIQRGASSKLSQT